MQIYEVALYASLIAVVGLYFVSDTIDRYRCTGRIDILNSLFLSATAFNVALLVHAIATRGVK